MFTRSASRSGRIRPAIWIANALVVAVLGLSLGVVGKQYFSPIKKKVVQENIDNYPNATDPKHQKTIPQPTKPREKKSTTKSKPPEPVIETAPPPRDVKVVTLPLKANRVNLTEEGLKQWLGEVEAAWDGHTLRFDEVSIVKLFDRGLQSNYPLAKPNVQFVPRSAAVLEIGPNTIRYAVTVLGVSKENRYEIRLHNYGISPHEGADNENKISKLAAGICTLISEIRRDTRITLPLGRIITVLPVQPPFGSKEKEAAKDLQQKLAKSLREQWPLRGVSLPDDLDRLHPPVIMQAMEADQFMFYGLGLEPETFRKSCFVNVASDYVVVGCFSHDLGGLGQEQKQEYRIQSSTHALTVAPASGWMDFGNMGIQAIRPSILGPMEIVKAIPKGTSRREDRYREIEILASKQHGILKQEIDEPGWGSVTNETRDRLYVSGDLVDLLPVGKDEENKSDWEVLINRGKITRVIDQLKEDKLPVDAEERLTHEQRYAAALLLKQFIEELTADYRGPKTKPLSTRRIYVLRQSRCPIAFGYARALLEDELKRILQGKQIGQ